MTDILELWGLGFPVNSNFALTLGFIMLCMAGVWLLSWEERRREHRP